MPEKVFSTRIDEELQREFRSIIVRRGKTVGSVVCQLMKDYIVNEGGTIPITADEWVDPIETGKLNAETLDALEEVNSGELISFGSKEKLFEYLDS